MTSNDKISSGWVSLGRLKGWFSNPQETLNDRVVEGTVSATVNLAAGWFSDQHSELLDAEILQEFQLFQLDTTNNNWIFMSKKQ